MGDCIALACVFTDSQKRWKPVMSSEKNTYDMTLFLIYKDFYLFRVVCILMLSSSEDPLPQFEGNGGDMMRACDGWTMKGDQIRSLYDRPALSLQVNNYQLLLHQDNQGTGISCRKIYSS